MFFIGEAARRMLCGYGSVLCHENVIHADNVNFIDPLRLELVVLLDVSRRLRVARRRECPRHANLIS
jgi:hypothetical protein